MKINKENKPLRLGVFIAMFVATSLVIIFLICAIIFYRGEFTVRMEADDNIVKATQNQYNPFQDFPKTYSTSEVIYLKDGSTKLCYKLNEDYGSIKKGDYLCPI